MCHIKPTNSYAKQKGLPSFHGNGLHRRLMEINGWRERCGLTPEYKSGTQEPDWRYPGIVLLSGREGDLPGYNSLVYNEFINSKFPKTLDVVQLSWLMWRLCNIAWTARTVPLEWPLSKTRDQRVCSYRRIPLLSLQCAWERAGCQ